MDGNIFFVLIWFLFIYLIFFTSAQMAHRNLLLWCCLLLISSSFFSFQVGFFTVTGSFLIFASLFLMRLNMFTSGQLLTIVSGAFISCFIFISVQMLALLNPTWTMMNDTVFQAAVIYIVLVLICRDNVHRLITFSFGAAMANVVFNMINFSMLPTLFDIQMKCLDILAILLYITFIGLRIQGNPVKVQTI